MVFSGSNIAKELIESGRNFIVYGDPDIDGMIAAYFVCQYLRKKGKSFDYLINSNRQHGFYAETDKLRGRTILAVDFSMTPDEIKEVVDAGANIVLIDHHTIGKSFVDYINGSNRGIIINNQYPFEPSNYRFLSGAGVVYFVLGYLMPEFFTEDNKALVGITLLSDIRAIESNEAIDFLKTTYNADTPMMTRLKDIVKPERSFSFGSIKMDRSFIDYNFSPKFNAMFRANKGYEAFEYMLGKPLDRQLIDSCKDFQNKVIDYIMYNMKGEDYGYLNCRYIEDVPMRDVVIETASDPIFLDSMLSNYIGLVASRIKGLGCSMVYIKNADGSIQRGSFRGTADYNYLDLFRDLGGIGDGHRNAFGFQRMIDCDLKKFNDILYAMSKFTDDSKRIVEIYNLSTVINTKNKDIAEFNTYCRSHKQIFFKYVGKQSSCEIIKQGERYRIWKVDGVEVKAFDLTLTPWDNYILPYKENRNYNVYYLKKEIY